MKKFCIVICLATTWCTSIAAAPLIDVVIPCHEKDKIVLERAIEGIKQNIPDVRRIIVVSAQKLTKNAEWFNEAWYPFSKHDILRAMMDNNEYFVKKFEFNPERCRRNWIYQQLLKFYAPFVIPNIADNVLIVDADTVFLNPTTFFDSEGNALYAYRKARFYATALYKKHAKRLVPSIIDHHPDIEGIAHHMLLQKAVLQDLFNDVFRVHHKEFWQAFCNLIDQKIARSGQRVRASEYEIYFSYIFSTPGRYKVRVRKLIAADVGSMDFFVKCKEKGYAFASYQHYLRHKPKIETSIP